MTFADLRLAEPILRAVTAEGYTTPTPIQAQAIPHVRDGKDLMGCAQTGTGKTAAFALPILHRLMEAKAEAKAHATGAPSRQGGAATNEHASEHRAGHEKSSHGHSHDVAAPPSRDGAHGKAPKAHARVIRALVLSPTRELAQQIADSFRTYGKHAGLRGTVIYGGVGQQPQTAAIKAGIDILVATPGRLHDLIDQGYVNLSHVEIFVLDEADRMLDMGFIEPIRKVVALLPKKRQNLMFSATMPKEIRHLADSILRDPVRVEVAPVATAAELVDQKVYFVDKGNKPKLLLEFLEHTSITRTLIFTRTKHGADRVTKFLNREGYRAEAIHGDKSQGQRTRALANFKADKTPILVATDIAARGLDVDNISHVVNFDVPHEPETYVHRIGRTGRAGATGDAVSFCMAEERPYLVAIERLMNKRVTVVEDHPYVDTTPHATPKHKSQGGRGGHHGGHRGSPRPPKQAYRAQSVDEKPHAHGGEKKHPHVKPQGGHGQAKSQGAHGHGGGKGSGGEQNRAPQTGSHGHTGGAGANYGARGSTKKKWSFRGKRR